MHLKLPLNTSAAQRREEVSVCSMCSIMSAMTTSCQEFEVSVHTSPGSTCGTFSRLWLTLIGSQGETLPISVNEGDHHLLPGSVCLVHVRTNQSLGRLVLVQLRLEAQTGFPDLDWHCDRVEVRRLTEEEGSEPEDPETQFVDGAPQCVDINSLSELGPNLCYTHKSSAPNLHYLKGFASRAEAWTSLTELETLFSHIGHGNNIAKFVRTHWVDDWYFGYQCLNGCNPLLLHQVHILPPNLSVTPEMLRPFLPKDSSLEQELQRGTMYLLDYEVLDGVPANVINGKQTYLSAPLCLLHLNQQQQLVPIAIQQTPGPENPVFLPSDPSCDWLLAKIWVHSADFQCHQLASHYLRTHMLGELCCVATLRQLPEVHPLHQLLMPHISTSLQINFQARTSLLAANGVFDKAVGCGLKALPVLLSRASQKIQYRSLCVPDDLSDRGVHELPQNHYAHDALRDFQTKTDLSKFITMMIFTSSALHAAVNFSQLDFALWIPNCPTSMRRPPPQVKGSATEDDIISSLPDANSSCRVLTTLAMLSQPAANFVPLCHYTEAIFREDTHRRLVEEVKAELQVISDDISERNRQLELPYPYLNPRCIDNSVAI
ncbi:hypothetical protein INR49_004600 [Caranx melampygus]|nr:hypothetical protein INR49_004600 [Caranx melampygus]